MKKMIAIIQANNLFFKIFIIMLISIITVSVSITFSTIRMSSDLYMERFSITNNKVIGQIKEQFDMYSFSVVSTYVRVDENGIIKGLLQGEKDTAVEKSQYFYHMKSNMDRIYAEVDPNEANMIIMSPDHDVFNMNYVSWPVVAEELAHHPITEQSRENPHQILYQFDASALTNRVPMIIATKALIERSSNEIYGYLYISIRERDLRNFYEGYTSEGNSIFLLQNTGQIISSDRQNLIGSESQELLRHVKELEQSNEEYHNVHIFNRNQVLMAEYLPQLDMYLVNLVDREALQQDIVDTKEIVMISIGIVLVTVLVIFLILRRMTVSISKLVRQISDMARYKFSKPLEETGGYESKKIAEAFNYMLNELHDYVEILIKTQEKQRKAELEVLQHQINPHFIYNTLASIKFMVKQEQKEVAFTTIDAFISLLQNALGDIDETVTVEQEMENLKNYVLINQARYGDRIKVNYLITPDCLGYRLPKLVLQPFIENAFFHAFTEKKTGFIRILIAEQDEQLVCEIIDNGDGMVQDQLTRKGKRQLFSGIGVKNVHERIQMLYGKEYGVVITSEPNKGTNVKVTLPIIQK
ncbi:two-component system, sensor histidine kinase YesM [Gracilibacillus ureilyticus]|uniref:Two-component system, sensor histidine kinase YesM n=1 Tax=Gracilibacillus ureilyticus TaxID=531814 RepID=A0A1H9R7M9_9BACI|nr:sensor histidine kinase [Gracilibacillus ureilyticus]SER68545.1 two-component system, sensor histidine kinase YesM [Gracilibacillus ureilyticus]